MKHTGSIPVRVIEVRQESEKSWEDAAASAIALVGRQLVKNIDSLNFDGSREGENRGTGSGRYQVEARISLSWSRLDQAASDSLLRRQRDSLRADAPESGTDDGLESGSDRSRVEAPMNVQSVMEKNVKSSNVEDSLADVARVMGENDCGALPIVDEKKKVVGMVTDRDVCLAMAAADRLPSAIPVREVMTKKVVSCGPSDDIADALQMMQKNRVRRLPVLDDGKLTGILSMDDVILHSESRRGKPAEIGYGDAVRTLKAIYRRTPQKKGAAAHA